MTLITNKPKMYLSIPNNAFFLIKLLNQKTGITTKEICLTLYKIKLNDTFALGNLELVLVMQVLFFEKLFLF